MLGYARVWFGRSVYSKYSREREKMLGDFTFLELKSFLWLELVLIYRWHWYTNKKQKNFRPLHLPISLPLLFYSYFPFPSVFSPSPLPHSLRRAPLPSQSELQELQIPPRNLTAVGGVGEVTAASARRLGMRLLTYVNPTPTPITPPNPPCPHYTTFPAHIILIVPYSAVKRKAVVRISLAIAFYIIKAILFLQSKMDTHKKKKNPILYFCNIYRKTADSSKRKQDAVERQRTPPSRLNSAQSMRRVTSPLRYEAPRWSSCEEILRL